MRLFLTHTRHQLLQSIVQEITTCSEWSSSDDHVNGFLVLQLVESTQLGMIIFRLRLAHLKLVQAVHIKARVAVVESFSHYHLTLVD